MQFRKIFDIIAFSDFLIAINKPFERKKIGYAGIINAQIFKYLEPQSITTLLFENKEVIKSEEIYKIPPEKIIIINEYLIAVK